jgi:hypothetical protein
VILLILLGILLFRDCDRSPEVVYVIPKIDGKPARDSANKYRELSQLHKRQADSLSKLKVKPRDRWHTIKRDSLIQVPVLIQVCDSTLAADSIHSAMQSLVIIDLDGEIKALRDIGRIDSTNHRTVVDSLKTANKGLKKEVRKQKWIKRGLIAAWLFREGVNLAGR